MYVYTCSLTGQPRPFFARIALVCSVLGLFGRLCLGVPPVDSLAPPKHPPTRVVPPGSPSSNFLPSAHGDWKQWRGNPQHTGYQSLAGKIRTPSVRWRYRLGGRVGQEQAVLCSIPGHGGDQLLIAPTGQLAAYTLDGTPVWQRRMSFDISLLGCWDLAADGRTEVVAATGGDSGGQIHVFDAANGALLWTSPATPGDVGAVKIVQLDDSPALELLWLPATSSTLRAYSFSTGVAQPRLLWSSEIADFISDPYTYSSLAVTGGPAAGRRVVISGARHQIPLIVLEASTGSEVTRRVYTEAQGVESGGFGQLLQLRDVDGTGELQVIAIAEYSSAQQYMFQGVSRTSLENTSDMQMLDTRPVGLHYARGSVGAFDQDRPDEILVSKFDPDARRNDLLMLSSIDLSIKATLPNFYLVAIADLGDSQGPFVIGLPGVSSETPSGLEPLVAVRYNGSEFRQTAWLPGTARLAQLLPRSFDDPAMDNAGASPVLLKSAAGSSILLQRASRSAGPRDILDLTDVASGGSLASYARPGTSLDLLVVRSSSSPADARIVVGGTDGEVVFLDGLLRPVRSVLAGGYYRNQAANAHAYEVAAIADLDGTGANKILAIDSRNRVLELSDAGPGATPAGRVFWDSGGTQELLVLPWSRGGSRVLLQSPGLGAWMLNLLDSSGAAVWSRPLPAGDGIPIGFNFGRFHDSAQADIVFSCGSNASFPRPTCAWDGATGSSLWRSPAGTYWDGTLAVWDFNKDGFDDVVSNFNLYKGGIISGRSGAPIGPPTVLPQYQDLESVDYNGAPMVVGDDGATTDFVNAGDNAHLALLVATPNAGSLAVTTAWADPQRRPDDQRYSMPAAAPDSGGKWLLGVGSQSGLFDAVNPDGTTAWSVSLWNGAVLDDGLPRQNPLSSVLAMDVAGNGQPSFVVGGSDGWLYALDARTGTLVWSLDLGAPVGDPIAADVDQSGFSAIVVPSADGYLYAIGNTAK